MTKINYEIKYGIIHKIIFTNGCNVNLQGICPLLVGMAPSNNLGKRP